MVGLQKSLARLVAPALVLSAAPLVGFTAAVSPVASASPSSVTLQAIRSFPTDELGVSRPVGLAWNAHRQALVLVESGRALAAVEVSPDERRLGELRLADVTDPGAVAVTPDGVTTAISEDSILRFTADGVQRSGAAGMDLSSPRGAAYDPAGGLVVLENDAVVRRSAKGQVQRINVSASADSDLRGLSTRPGSNLLYTYDAASEHLLGLDGRGQVVERFDLGAVAVEDVRGVVVAASADSTDDPSTQSVYLADAGGRGTLGQIVEVPLYEQFAAAAVANASVVRTVDTSRFSPASPDPSGIAYLPQADRLMIGDGEVDEMSIFRDANMFRTTRAGTVDSTGVSMPWGSKEPVGVGYIASTNHLLVSDDDEREVYEIAAGSDGRFGSSDDAVTHFDTYSAGAGDPEGVEYDPATNSIWTVDGVNREVYRFRPGSDGRWGTSDDLHSSFDTAKYGTGDPEGIAYDSVRDTLVILDDMSQAIYELDRTGALLNTISLPSGAVIDTAAGITIAPGSVDSSRRNYYVVARGVDNNDDPSENDGKMFELSASLPSLGNRAPSVNAGVDATVVLPAAVSLDGTVDDDGLPSSGSLTTMWSKVSGPGDVTFESPTVVDTTASFTTAGTYVLRLTANDGELSSYDDVTVTVSTSSGGGGGTTQTVEVRVGAGSDDAEQRSATPDLTSSDLELPAEGTSSGQVVGMRFVGVQVPAGATVTSAYLQFQTDEITTAAASMMIRAEASDNAPTYQATTNNVASRVTTGAGVSWAPPAWSSVGEAGLAQRTPNLAAVVQEVVSRPGWTQGNAMALQVSGSGTRTAEAYNGVPSAAPLLHVEYSTGSGGGSLNQAPVVRAGADQTVTLPASAQLAGTVTDDGLPNPPGAVTTRWSQVSGPAPVQFGNAASVDTTASFSADGTYVLRLTASDGQLTSQDDVTVTVSPGSGSGTPQSIDVRVAASSDDAEQRTTGSTSLTSSDLELTTDGTTQQVVGMRFAGVGIPAGATVTKAYVQFRTNEVSTGAASLTIRAEAADNAPTYQATSNNVTSRATTGATATWTPPDWTTKGEVGTPQKTPELAALVQAVVSRSGWRQGNALALQVSGTGRRTADAYDGAAATAPLLHVEYTVG